MTLKPLFPFRLYCNREKGWSERTFSEAFHAGRAGRHWYGYDVVVNSPTSVTFIAYEMADMVYGWCGGEVFRFDSEVSVELTRKHIEARALVLGARRRERELAEAEEAIAKGYAQELLAELSL